MSVVPVDNNGRPNSKTLNNNNNKQKVRLSNYASMQGAGQFLKDPTQNVNNDIQGAGRRSFLVVSNNPRAQQSVGRTQRSTPRPARGTKTSIFNAGVPLAGGKRSELTGKRRSTVQGAPSNIVVNEYFRTRLADAWESFQYGQLSTEIRKFFRGKLFGIISVIALLGALYLPDLFILMQANDAAAPDGVLTLIMLVFAAEFLLLSIVDPNYLFGAFWWMDLVGTASMIFDITYLLAQPPDWPTVMNADMSSGEGTAYLVYLRAGRMAKLGARAGRISRVLKILRFLPFLQVQDQDSTMMAHKISSQLSNVLGTRIAFLTLIMAVLMPMPGIFMFPIDDYSMKFVPMTVSRRLRDVIAASELEGLEIIQPETEKEQFIDSVNFMGNFYDQSIGYGVFSVFIGKCDSKASPPYCDDWIKSSRKMIPRFRTKYYAPVRKADTRYKVIDLAELKANSNIVPDNTPQIGAALAALDRKDWDDAEIILAYNMEGPIGDESSWNLGVITFVMTVMVLSGLLLSNAVSDLALRPMERMLTMVREIAKTIFKNYKEEEEDYEEDDLDNTTEMVLLEKIVVRVATISNITTQKVDDLGNNSNMKSEDLGILNLMMGQGDNTKDTKVRESKSINNANPQTEELAKKVEIGSKITGSVTAFGVSEKDFTSWNFLTSEVTEVANRIALVGWILLNHPSIQGLRPNLDPKTVTNTLTKAEAEYINTNPYHNFFHAIDVVHTEHRLLMETKAELFFSEIDQFALLLSAIFHDVGHPGTNNPFLIDTGHELAIRYNDRSPLENMHCAKLFEILNNKETKLLESFPTDQFKEIRKITVEVILHTDVVHHFTMVKEINVLYQMNNDLFQPSFELTEDPSPIELELFGNPETKKLLLNMYLHTADISNPCKPWKVCHAWALRVLEEFFVQGDIEKELGVPIQMLNDRTKVNTPNSQIGFIEFIVTPLIASCIRILPYFYIMGDNIESNIKQWSRVWILESCPAEEEQHKVNARVEKVSNLLTDSKSRIPKRDSGLSELLSTSA